MEMNNYVVLLKRDHFTCPKCRCIVVGIEQLKIHEITHFQLLGVVSVDESLEQGGVASRGKQEDTRQKNEGAANGVSFNTSIPPQKPTKKFLQKIQQLYKCWLCPETHTVHWSFVKHMESHKARHPELVAGLIKLIPAMRRERIDYNRELEAENSQTNL